MRSIRRTAFAVIASAILGLTAGPALAETGVTADTILLGQTAALSGPLAQLGTDYRDGAQLWFDAVNHAGGVHGRRVQLLSLDDGYDPRRGEANVRKLLEQDKVFGLFGPFGTGVTLKIVPMAAAARVPVFAPYSGADALREPGNRYLFHIRASYGEEMGKIVEQLVTTGVASIGVVYQNDAFGKSGLAGVEAALAKHKLKPVAVAPIDAAAGDAHKAAQTLAGAAPLAIVMATAGKSSAAFIKACAEAGCLSQFYALSVADSRALAALGPQARGVVVAQVTPSPWHVTASAAREYQRLAKAAKKEASYASFEGFLAARVYVEALRRAGPELTREQLVATLEGMRSFDAGEFLVSFSPRQHAGSSYVELSIMTADGKFLR